MLKSQGAGMRQITIDIQHADKTLKEQAWLLIPRPFNDWHQKFHAVDCDGITQMREIQALNSGQRAYLLKTSPELSLAIQYQFVMTEDNQPPDWFWQQQKNRHTSASDELSDLAHAVTQKCIDQPEAIRCLIEHAAEIFGYGHRDQYIHHGQDSVPVICGTTRGSCVDINTYRMAAARSLDIAVQYVAGYWFHPDKSETPDMHCWLAFQNGINVQFWDRAHHLKWGVNELAPGLNPAGGRRVTMSCGRGLCFETPCGTVEISHFSEPVWVLPETKLIRPELTIRIHDEG